MKMRTIFRGRLRGICFLLVAVFPFGFLGYWFASAAEEESHSHSHSYPAHVHPWQAATNLPDRIILTWTDDPATTIDVTWRTATSVTGTVVEYAKSDELLGDLRRKLQCQEVVGKQSDFETDRETYAVHSTHLADLEPSTVYAYRVGDGAESWSEWFQFRTASDKAEPFSFVYFGDAQNDVRSWWSRVIREAHSEAPRAAFMLHAGDLINQSERDEEWGEWFGAGGWLNAMVPSVATPGNHEYPRSWGFKKLTPHWRQHFAFPLNGPEGLEESAYWFDYQGVRFISLNSNEKLEKQAKWLSSVLEDHPTDGWKIVTYHHPAYAGAMSRDKEDIRNTWKPLFEKYKIDLALQGHDHVYTRTGLGGPQNVPSGVNTKSGHTLYVVSVSGPKMYPLGVKWEVERKASGVQLYQIIHVDGKSLKYESRRPSGKLYDAFTLEKQSDGSNILTNEIPETPEIIK